MAHMFVSFINQSIAAALVAELLQG